MPPLAIRAVGLIKRYGRRTALGGFDLSVPPGTVCGLLGPNGAGKTTAVRVLCTLLPVDGGRAEVAGFDVAREPARVRSRIGLVAQGVAIDEILSGRQNLMMFGRLCHLSASSARRRANELLDCYGLADAADRQVKEYSGGMRRRLDLAVGLILAPSVLFLDEPTIGLDPRARSEVWSSIRALVASGTTVLLTTQYLEEADQLADRIALIDRGRVIADGTPDELKATLGADHIDVVVRKLSDLATAAAIVQHSTAAAPTQDPDTRRLSVPTSDRVHALTAIVRGLEEAGIGVEDVVLRRPTLDEVFLHLTGQGAEREECAATA